MAGTAIGVVLGAALIELVGGQTRWSGWTGRRDRLPFVVDVPRWPRWQAR